MRKNFKSATLEFLFIIAFVNGFQWVFGAENSIIGVVFAIMMAASMARDLTAAPVRHLLFQALVLTMMTVAACFVASLDPWFALILNIGMCFFLLYTFTFEYMSNLYFPYILSYLFMVFITPVPAAGLPKRLLGVLAGSACIIVYQLVKGRKRIRNTVKNSLTHIVDTLLAETDGAGEGTAAAAEEIRRELRKISRAEFERRKRPLRISSAGFAAVDSARGLEHLYLLLMEKTGRMEESALNEIRASLRAFRDFIVNKTPMPAADDERVPDEVRAALAYIRDHLLRMTDKEQRRAYPRSASSFFMRLRAAVSFSPVRLAYAARVTVLIAGFTLLVRLLDLPHGKWLLFTIASVSLPYADDVTPKARKRLLATLLGGALAALLFSLLPWGWARTALMMLSGYVSYYFTGYTATYACSTVGALGGAVFVSAFGWRDVWLMFGIRVGYICAGIVIAYVCNKLIFPFKRKTASRQLWLKYQKTVLALTELCARGETDDQLYYSLVLQSHMMEDRLCANAAAAGWNGMESVIDECRAYVRAAHRKNRGGSTA